MVEKLVIEEKPFPDDLEGRLNAILNVVNTELKSVALLHLDNHAVTGYELLTRVRRTVGKDIYLPRYPSFLAYCSNTLFPIGMVAKEVVLSEGDITIETAYKLSKVGEKYGLPIAVFALDWAVKNNLSLYSILGQTASSHKIRSPINRVNILQVLASGPESIQEKDLIELVGELSSTNATSHLRALKDIGFIYCDSVGDNEDRIGRFVYEFVGSEDALVPVMSCINLTAKVYNALKELKKADYRELAKKIDYPNIDVISSILAGLVKQGHAKPQRWSMRGYKSLVSITEKGKEFVFGFFEPLKNALEEECYLMEMEDYYTSLINYGKRFNELLRRGIELYRLVSPNVNRREKNDRINQIINFIENHPGIKCLEIEGETKLGQRSVNYYLAYLVSRGQLRTEIKSGVAHYYLV